MSFLGSGGIRWIGRCSVGLLLLAALTGCAAHHPGISGGQVPAFSAQTPTASPYLLVPGDVIDVKFYYSPELNEELTIRPDGFISLQLVGEVRAAGLAPGELARQLHEAFSSRIRNAEVAVIVKTFSAQQVYVGGEVASPGTFPLQGRVTCVQALFGRGGAKPSGRLSQVLLLRHVGADTTDVREIDLGRVLSGKEPDMVLQPFDVLFVPRTTIARVGQFVQQYIDDIVPRSLSFPYSLNSRITVR